MANVLIQPVSGAIQFNNQTCGSSTVPDLSSNGVKLFQVDDSGLQVESHFGGLTGGTRFSVAGDGGQLLSITDSLTGDIFSVNDASGLPIINVNSCIDDVVKVGSFNTNALVVSGTSVAIGTDKVISNQLSIAGKLSAADEIAATSLDISGNVDIDGTLETDALSLNGTTVTSTAAELNKLDGVTATASELNCVDGLTSTTAELNTLDGFNGDVNDLNYAKTLCDTGVTGTEFNCLDGLTATTSELNKLDGVTATASELNCVDGLTSTTAELNTLDGFNGDVNDLNYAKTLCDTGVTGTEFNCLDGLTATTTELNYVDGVTSSIQTQINSKGTGTVSSLSDLSITASASELNKMDGVTSSTAELNCVDGLTSTTAELNTLDGFTGNCDDLNYAATLRATGVTGTEFNCLDGLTATTSELNCVDGLTATTSELNTLDGFTGNCDDLNYAATLRATGVTGTEFNCLDGLTATTSELNKLDGVTATASELNCVDGLTATTTELNYVDGVTSSIQTQLNAKGAGDITGVTAGTNLNGGGSSGSVTVNLDSDPTLTGLTVDNICIDGSAVKDGSNHLCVCSGGDVILDSSNGDIKLHDDGTNWGMLRNSSTHFVICNITNDKDILFCGVDNSSNITALTLDMSDAGTATFNNKVCMGNSKLVLNGTAVTSTAAELNKLDGVTSTATELNCVDGLTSTTAELNTLDGFNGDVNDLNYAKTLCDTGVTGTEFNCLDGLTATTSELNKLDGVTSTTAELNCVDGLTATTTELNYVDGVTSSIQTQLNSKGTGTVSSLSDLSITSTAAELNTLDGFNGDVTDLNYAKTLYDTGVTGTEFNCLDGLTATTSELNKLDGVTSTTAELNCVDGLTATTTELNYVDGVTSSIQTQLNSKGTGTVSSLSDLSITSTAAELNTLDGFTGDVNDLNYAKTLYDTGVTGTEFNCLDGLTATTSELNKLDGVTATTSELNCVDGLTATTTELNYVDGVTSSIQTQLNSKGAGTVTSVDDGNGLTGGAITTTGSLAVGAGTGITVNTNDVAVTAAQTGITSIKNSSLAIGRDDHNLIKFSTDNNIIFETSNSDQGCIDANGDFIIAGHVCVGDGHDVCTDEVRARDSAGLSLNEDGGNGIFIKDGGNVAIGSTTADDKLQICAGSVALTENSGYSVKWGSCSSIFNYGDLYICQSGSGNIRLETTSANSDIDICVANASGTKYNIAKFDGSACVTDFTGMVRAEQQICANTSTTYTFVLADHGKLVTSSNGSAQTLTVPPNSSVAYPIGADLTVMQLGSGQVTIAAGSGVTLYAADSELKTRVQYSAATLTKVASDAWLVAGDLTA